MTQDYASPYRYDYYKKDRIRKTPIAFEVLDRTYTFIVVLCQRACHLLFHSHFVCFGILG